MKPIGIKRTLGWVVVFSLGLLACGCAGSQATRNGFLSGYQGFKDVSAQKNLLLREQAAVSWKDYRRVIIEPVEFAPGVAGREQISAAERESLTRCFGQALAGAFKNDLEVVGAPGPQTLRIRSAITGVDASNPALNLVTTLALFVPLDNGGVSLELEVLDSVTDQPVAAVIAWDRGSPLQFKESFHRFGHARRALRKKAGQVADVLIHLQAASS